ncbi:MULTISPECIES: T9SS type A sorting domain-containing protein [unclassified Lentimicrobium]|uniref:T9SS type A sorting domain-containing protein n=1 Tax=unclassified Lentimicrobium TaxID=2677434 RepID=UPI0015566B69|nr:MULTISPECIES: right-handed parallel beta-helix repeat-containing protein [unclassified Lentimicrobium]NPD46194.1 T9SS type A sorting domain-containing protein [Lentimicrobium sp. S6]NPD83245.1 T9SS type A sorting domain-containing protein [Lentimicrobium sp. L6]
MRLLKQYIFLILIIFSSVLTAQKTINCDYIIEVDDVSITNHTANPGDTMCLMAGVRPQLYMKNIEGTADEPIVIINYGGVVNIETELSYGLKFAFCRYIKLTGTGDSNEEYGIQIDTVALGNGIDIGFQSSDFEVENVEVQKTKYVGIMAKTDPDCTFSAVRDSFTMYNVNIHDNYLHHIGTEGMYIGNSFFLGHSLSACDTVVLPHIIEGVKVYNNIVHNTGWDGIQVGCALYNCDIYNNDVYLDSQEEQTYQMSGIIVNTGSSCDVHDNIIIDGKGTGIFNQGTGGQYFFNNLIVNAGRDYFPEDQILKQQFGIFSKYQYILPPDSNFYFFNNTIINPKSDGIRFYNANSDHNVFSNNIILNPGAFDYYTENGSVNNTGADSYIHNYLDCTIIDTSNNIFERSSKDQYFVDTTEYNYRLTNNSPAVNIGDDVASYDVFWDLDGNVRPYNNAADIGAYEYQSSSTSALNEESHLLFNIIPNPSDHFIQIEIPIGFSSECHIEILNIKGERMYLDSMVSDDKRIIDIDISKLSEDMYFIRLIDGKKVVVEKFIKN